MSETTLDDMLTKARRYPRIIVLGPQRSGTNLAARILSDELALPLVSERELGCSSCTPEGSAPLSAIIRFAEESKRYVLQAPALTYTCHTLAVLHAFVCFMRRDADEIEASRTRSRWPGEARERAKYAAAPFTHPGVEVPSLAEAQLYAWEYYQREHMQLPFVELSYEALSAHPLWRARDEREELSIGEI